MNDQERLEGLTEVLERLSEMTSDHILLVEGLKDIAALKELGIAGAGFFAVDGIFHVLPSKRAPSTLPCAQ